MIRALKGKVLRLLLVLSATASLNFTFINCGGFKVDGEPNGDTNRNANSDGQSANPVDNTPREPASIPIVIQPPPVVVPPVVVPPGVATPTPTPTPTPPVANTTPVKVSFVESTNYVPNPEKGFYDRVDINVMTESLLTNVRDKGSANFPYPMRLVYSQVDISQFRTSDFSSAFLVDFENKLKMVRNTSVKLVLRFVYDDSAGGYDATVDQVQRQLAQLKPILVKYDDTIAYFQAGFIGAWGEWHSSQAGNSYGYNSVPGVTEALADSRRLAIRDALVANVPPSIRVSFRLPGDLIKWSTAGGGVSALKLGFINDCWMAGPDDMGTYSSNSERDFIKQLTMSNPFGGETCSDTGIVLRNSCVQSTAEAKDYHLTYLNSGYSPDFLKRWKTEGCLEEMGQKMGYGYSLQSITYPMEVKAGTSFDITSEIKNKGWSKLFKSRNFEVLLTDIATKKIYSFFVGSTEDYPVAMTTAKTSQWTLTLPANFPAGQYMISIGLPDSSLLNKNLPALARNSFNSIRFLNSDSPTLSQKWDPIQSAYQTGAIIKVVP